MKHKRIHAFCWNVGGLTVGMLGEIMIWLSQKTIGAQAWCSCKRDMERTHQNGYRVTGSACRVVLLLSAMFESARCSRVKVFVTGSVRHHSIHDGSLLHVRAEVGGPRC